MSKGALRRGRRTPTPGGTGYRAVARNAPLAPPSAASDEAREPSPVCLKDSLSQVLDRWFTTKSLERIVPGWPRAQGRFETGGTSLVGRIGAPLLACLFAVAGFRTNRVSAVSLPGSPRREQ